MIGLLIVIAGKVSLGRSFGLIPANRGIVSTGLYRLVRHPIYLGTSSRTSRSSAPTRHRGTSRCFVIADIALLARAVCEERTLSRDAAYRSYQTPGESAGVL